MLLLEWIQIWHYFLACYNYNLIQEIFFLWNFFILRAQFNNIALL